MPEPSAFIGWLERQVVGGKYLICLGEPGIDYGGGVHTPTALRARYWKLLGLADTGRWQQVTYDQRVQFASAGLIGFERKLGPVLPPYRMTVPIRPDVRTHLSIGPVKRRNVPGAVAHLVVTSDTGGYAAVGYTYCEPAPGRRQWYIDPVEFLRLALRLDGEPRGRS
jgi:hypothetical protein